MKKIVALVLLASCASHTALNCQQICAEKSMICSGMTSDSGVGTAHNFQTNQNTVIRTSGESYQCRVPANESEGAPLAKYQSEAADLRHENSSATWRNVLYWTVGIGAVVGISFLIPTHKTQN